jgi:hypothetical protein
MYDDAKMRENKKTIKKSQLEQLIREEIKRVLKEAIVNNTLQIVISFEATGTGVFYKSSVITGPYKGPKTFNIKAISASTPKDLLAVIPAMSLKSFAFNIWLLPSTEDEVYNRAVELIENFFKDTKDDMVAYNDKQMEVIFQNAGDLKTKILTTLKAMWKPTWAAKSPKFNLG